MNPTVTSTDTCSTLPLQQKRHKNTQTSLTTVVEYYIYITTMVQ